MDHQLSLPAVTHDRAATPRPGSAVTHDRAAAPRSQRSSRRPAVPCAAAAARAGLVTAWLAVWVAAPAIAETRAQYGGNVQATLASAPTTLDPLRGGPGDAEVVALVFDTPFALDATGRPRPSLALALDNPEGAVRVRLTLRADVRFSDGTALSARDVAASLTRALRDPAGWPLAPIRAARAIADDVVELELARATPELPLLLTTPAAMVTPGGAAPARKTIGSGPFIVDGADAQSVRLVANPGCFAGRPYLAALTLRAFASRGDEAGSFEVGSLHALRHALPAADDGSGRRAFAAIDGPQTITGFIAVGRIADAEALRRVLALAINRDRLRRLTVREPAIVAAGAVPPALGGLAAKPAYDPARARAEVERRWPGARPRVSLLVDASRLDDRDVAERILADLARVGIDVTIEAVDAAAYQSRLDGGRYELVLGAAAPPAPDGGLGALALLAVVDPAAARAALVRGLPPSVDLEATRVVPLFHRAARLQAAPNLRDLRVDGAGRAGWADAHWIAR
jgi:peptide/nickel transport system substrate-binding protein